MKITAALFVLVGLLTSGIDVVAAPLKVHIISGSAEYRSEASLKEFAAYLQQLGVAEMNARHAVVGGVPSPRNSSGVDAACRGVRAPRPH